MNSVISEGAKSLSAPKPKKKILSYEGGEDSAAAKEDRLRISSFQNFWKSVHENIVLLRSIGPLESKDASNMPTDQLNINKVRYLFRLSY